MRQTNKSVHRYGKRYQRKVIDNRPVEEERRRINFRPHISPKGWTQDEIIRK